VNGGAAASLWKSARIDKTATVIRKIFQIILWLAAGAYVVVGVLAITGVLGNAREADSLGRAYAVFGSMILMIGAMAAVATFLANKWPGWLFVALLVLCVGLPVGFFGAFWIDMEKGEVHRRQFQEEVRSGRYAFGNQPALLAVAQAVSANDHDAIRAAAKAVPDLQAPGRDGTTLLCWAVRETWQRPQLVESVRTLLSLGADPNLRTAIGNRSRWPTPCTALLAFSRACSRPAEIRMLATNSADRSFSRTGTWVITKTISVRGSICCWIAAPTSTPRCPKANRNLPVIPYCSIAREWGLMIAARTRMRCICSNAARIRIASPVMK
jgi:hypothetical protein